MAEEAQRVPILITIGVSHFCEKARWALERYGVEYVEETHAPGFHVFALKRVGALPRSSTPCLVLPGGKLLHDSSIILKYASDFAAPPESLFPPSCSQGDIERWCTRFDKELGPDVRSYFYSRTLFKPRLSGPALMYRLKPWSSEWILCSLGFLWPTRLVMKQGMKISRENGDRALQRINELFRETDEALSDGRKFLCGDRFSAADLTLAALAAGLTGMNRPGLPPPHLYPPEVQQSIERIMEEERQRRIR